MSYDNRTIRHGREGSKGKTVLDSLARFARGVKPFGPPKVRQRHPLKSLVSLSFCGCQARVHGREQVHQFILI
jgi:hypothetical protein